MGKSRYTQAIADAICERLAAGESLNAICKSDEIPVTESTVRLWALDDIEGFAAKYTRAREIGYDCMAEEIVRIADESRIGTKTTVKASGTETTDGDMVDRSRLQVDARKWLLSKMLPKKYGEKVAVTGEGGGPLHMLLGQLGKSSLPIASDDDDPA